MPKATRVPAIKPISGIVRGFAMMFRLPATSLPDRESVQPFSPITSLAIIFSAALLLILKSKLHGKSAASARPADFVC
jgi:hypothetical protein